MRTLFLALALTLLVISCSKKDEAGAVNPISFPAASDPSVIDLMRAERGEYNLKTVRLQVGMGTPHRILAQMLHTLQRPGRAASNEPAPQIFWSALRQDESSLWFNVESSHALNIVATGTSARFEAPYLWTVRASTNGGMQTNRWAAGGVNFNPEMTAANRTGNVYAFSYAGNSSRIVARMHAGNLLVYHEFRQSNGSATLSEATYVK